MAVNSWDSVGARPLAGDIVLNAARQVRALRSLSASLARCSEGGTAGSSRADTHLTRREEEHRERRSSLPRRRSHDQASHHAKRSDESRRRAHQRGGRKHQRLGRLATNLLLEVHRKPSEDFWALTSTRERPFELGNLCK